MTIQLMSKIKIISDYLEAYGFSPIDTKYYSDGIVLIIYTGIGVDANIELFYNGQIKVYSASLEVQNIVAKYVKRALHEPTVI